MAKTENMSVRIDPSVRYNAEIILGQLGLTASAAFNIFMRQVVMKGGLPFEILVPEYNAETLAAMKEAYVISKTADGGYDNMKDLMSSLRA